MKIRKPEQMLASVGYTFVEPASERILTMMHGHLWISSISIRREDQ